jgi:hypothetical protein
MDMVELGGGGIERGSGARLAQLPQLPKSRGDLAGVERPPERAAAGFVVESSM